MVGVAPEVMLLIHFVFALQQFMLWACEERKEKLFHFILLYVTY